MILHRWFVEFDLCDSSLIKRRLLGISLSADSDKGALPPLTPTAFEKAGETFGFGAAAFAVPLLFKCLFQRLCVLYIYSVYAFEGFLYKSCQNLIRTQFNKVFDTAFLHSRKFRSESYW